MRKKPKLIAVPEEFHHKVKVKAANEGLSIKDIIMQQFPREFMAETEKRRDGKNRPKW